MTKEEQILEQYERKLTELYVRANTKSKKKRIVCDLFRFSNMCYEEFGIDKEFAWDNDTELLMLVEDYYSQFIENTLENRDLYLKMAKDVIEIFKKIDYPLYKDYEKRYRVLKDKEFQEILFAFLNNYDPKLLKRFKEKFDNFEIFEGGLEEASGITYSIGCINKNLIFLSSNGRNSLFEASVLAHEFGHAYELELYQKIGKSSISTKSETTPYYEVSSRFFEYAFIKFLEENNIHLNDSKMCLRNYFLELLWRMCDISVLGKMKQINIDEHGLVKIEDEKVSLHGNKLKEKLNFCLPNYELGEAIEYTNPYIYGIGSLFSVYLYESYKQDPNNFRKQFGNVLLAYPNSGITAFERVGVTPEILSEGKVLRRTLEDSKK